MRAASIAFPFRQTFRRLELEKHWRHRLCVVIFFATLFGATAFNSLGRLRGVCTTSGNDDGY